MRSALTFVLGTALLLPSAVAAQGRSERIATQRGAMQRLADWVGEWQGSGWVETRPGETARFTGTVSVEYRVDDLVMLVDSEFVAADGPVKGQVVSNSLEVIWFDSDLSKFQVETHAGVARHGTHDGTFEDATLSWQRSGRDRDNETRYSIKVVDGRWVQIGERRANDQAPWRKTLEIELKPVASGGNASTPATRD